LVFENNTLTVFVNDKERNKVEVSLPLRELLCSQIRLGGHLESQENEQCKTKNLYHGLMKGFVLIINPNKRYSVEPNTLEESKVEEVVREMPDVPVME
jgi:hypothetical protein